VPPTKKDAPYMAWTLLIDTVLYLDYMTSMGSCKYKWKTAPRLHYGTVYNFDGSSNASERLSLEYMISMGAFNKWITAFKLNDLNEFLQTQVTDCP
jgi:hypothetical protein